MNSEDSGDAAANVNPAERGSGEKATAATVETPELGSEKGSREKEAGRKAVTERTAECCGGNEIQRGLGQSILTKIKEIDGILLLFSLIITVVISFFFNYSAQIERQVVGSRSIVKESFHAFNELAFYFDKKEMDADRARQIMRNLRFLHYTSADEIPAARKCLDILIERIDLYSKTETARALVKTRRNGEISAEDAMSGNVRNLVDRIDKWNAQKSSPISAALIFFGIRRPNEIFNKCLFPLE